MGGPPEVGRNVAGVLIEPSRSQNVCQMNMSASKTHSDGALNA